MIVFVARWCCHSLYNKLEKERGCFGIPIQIPLAQRQWLAANTNPKGRNTCLCVSVLWILFLMVFGIPAEKSCTPFDNATDIADNVTMDDANACCHGDVMYGGECICEEGYEGLNCALKIAVNVSKCKLKEEDSLRGGSSIFVFGVAVIVLSLGALFIYQSLADSRAAKEAEEKINAELEVESNNPATGFAPGGRTEAVGGARCDAPEEDKGTLKKKVTFPKVEPGVHWNKDPAATSMVVSTASATAAAAEGNAQAQVSGRQHSMNPYSVDYKTLEAFRDWFQIMSLIFSAVVPAVPVWTASFGVVFNFVGFDFAAALKHINIGISYDAITVGWNNIIYFLAAFLLAALIYLELTMASEPDQLSDGRETMSRKELGNVKGKLRILQACHFLYLPVCSTVFSTWYKSIFLEQNQGVFSYGFSFVLFFAFIALVPFRTYLLIIRNKSRGSTEDANFAFDEEGNKVLMTDELYNAKVQALLNEDDVHYNPWAALFDGYQRNWAEFTVLVMIIKLLMSIAVLFLSEAKFMQNAISLVIVGVWMVVVKVATPYISDTADSMDFACKISQVVVLVFSMITLVVCESADKDCAKAGCYSPGGAGFALGVVVNVFAGLCLIYQIGLVVSSMPCCILRSKNSSGEFTFTDHDCRHKVDVEVKASSASLIYNLRREKKFRVWYPFWNGLFKEFKDNEDDEPAKALGERWQEINRCAQDAGVSRVTAWLEQSNPAILEAREFVVHNLEGIDVLCDRSCLTVDSSDNATELINTATGGDKILSSKTCFAKVYTSPFPLRAVVVWDDCGDRAMLYDAGILKLATLNRQPNVIDKILLRKQLRCLHNTRVNFEFYRFETRKVGNGDKKKDVNVKMTYKTGLLTIQQTLGKNTVKSAGTEFDLSPGFVLSVAFNDGEGHHTEPGMMWNGPSGDWTAQPCVLSMSELGITDAFTRDGKGPYQRDAGARSGIFVVAPPPMIYNLVVPEGVTEGQTFRADVGGTIMAIAVPAGCGPGFTIAVEGAQLAVQSQGGYAGGNVGVQDLINDNWAHICQKLPEMDAQRQRYRDTEVAKVAKKEDVLLSKFWPVVYNNPDLDAATLEQWMADNASPKFSALCSQQENAFAFLWARHDFVSASIKNLYWFTVFDDLWTRNFEMAVLVDKSEEFGSTQPSSIVYNPVPRDELETFLKTNNLLDSAPKYFHDELLSKLYRQMDQAHLSYNLTEAVKQQLQGPDHGPQ